MAASPARAERLIKLRADRVETDRTTGVSAASGNVRVEVEGGVVLTTERVSFDQNKKEIKVDAPFTLVQQGPDGKMQTVTGTGLDYLIDEDKAIVQGGRVDTPAKTPGQVIYITGKEISSYQKAEFEVKEGTFTTCDFIAKQETPHYHLECDWIKYVPGNYAMGTGVKVFINNRQVAWLPFFWIPIQQRESSVSTGRNNIEGLFAKTRLTYGLLAPNDGTLFLDGLEFKNPGGIGFDQQFGNRKTWQTNLTLYGLLLPDQFDNVPDSSGNYAVTTNPWVVNRLNPFSPTTFQDHLVKIRHQQRLLDTMTLDGSWEDKNLYDLTAVSPTTTRESLQQNPQENYRDDHTAWSVGLADVRFGLTYGLGRNYREDYGFASKRNRAIADRANLSGTFGGTSFNGTTARSETSNPSTGLQPVYTRIPDMDVPVSRAIVTSNSNWTNNLNINQTFTQDIRGTLGLNHTRTDPPPGLGQTRQERLTQTSNLTQELHDLGNVRLDSAQVFNLAIPATASVAEQKRLISQLGNVDKIPELTYNPPTFLQNLQPINTSFVYGRYIEDVAYDPSASETNPNPATHLDPVTRLKFTSSLGGKPLDLGLGAGLNFGSTGYEQRYYSTGDAEFRTSGQVQFTHDLAKTFGLADSSKTLSTSVTYHRDFTPPAETGETGANAPSPFPILGLNGYNASPFKQFDSLALSRQNNLNGSSNVALGDFHWNNSLGYDYDLKHYTPYSTGVNYNIGQRARIDINTGYTFADKPYLEFGTGKWSDVSSTLHLQSGDTGFGGVYGNDGLTPGWSFDTTLGYSIDAGEWRTLTNRLLIETGTTWQSHWAFTADGQYNVTSKQYEVLSIGINKDLHDFILSVQYNKRLESFTLNLAMVAFPTNLVNLSNKTFAGLGDPSALGQQFGLSPNILQGVTQ